MWHGIYLSSDELERSDALEYGYLTVCQHPREVRQLIAGQRLVIDLNHVLFDAQDEAVQLACAAAEQGLWVGIRTYYPEHPRLLPLLGKPNVVIEKTHGQVCQTLRRASRQQAVGDRRRHHPFATKETIQDPVTLVEGPPDARTGRESPENANGFPASDGVSHPAPASEASTS